MRRLMSFVIVCGIIALADTGRAAPIYQWRDGAGRLHYSNRHEVVPAGATEVTLPPLPEPSTVRAVPVARALVSAAPVPTARAASRCAAPDAGGLVSAVADRLGTRQLGALTLFVGGAPVAYGTDARIGVKGPDDTTGPTAATAEAALAYPAGTRCPTRPPLEHYTVTSARRGPSRRLCDDFRRAFAEVGVAVSRDQGVARSFRELAAHFVDVRRRGYTAGGRQAFVVSSAALVPVGYAREEEIPLAPWVVEAHVAQTRELAAESAGLVDELSVALEEIDAAARRAGCW